MKIIDGNRIIELDGRFERSESDAERQYILFKLLVLIALSLSDR